MQTERINSIWVRSTEKMVQIITGSIAMYTIHMNGHSKFDISLRRNEETNWVCITGSSQAAARCSHGSTSVTRRLIYQIASRISDVARVCDTMEQWNLWHRTIWKDIVINSKMGKKISRITSLQR